MNESREIAEAIQAIAKTGETQYQSLICTVDSVNLSARTCVCTPNNGSAQFTDVLLNADKTNSFLLVPSVGGKVEVTQLSDEVAFISMVGDLDEIYMLGDANEGIVKVIELTQKLNNLENDINNLKAAFSAWVTVPNDGGAALKAAAASWYGASLTPTTKAEIQNSKIQHGNG